MSIFADVQHYIYVDIRKNTNKYRHTFFIKCGSLHTESISSLDSFGATSKVRVVGATKMSECVTTEQSGTGMGLVPREATIITGPETLFFLQR